MDLRRFITCRSVCWHQWQTWRGFDLQWHNSVRGNNSWIWTMWRAEGKQVELIHSRWPQQSRTNQDIKLQKKKLSRAHFCLTACWGCFESMDSLDKARMGTLWLKNKGWALFQGFPMKYVMCLFEVTEKSWGQQNLK